MGLFSSFDVFLSYSRAQTDRVRPLVQDLESRGYKVFFDQQSIEPGSNWKERLRGGIRQARAMILCWSVEAKASEYIQFEFNQALGLKKTVIPWLLDRTPLPDMHRDLQGIVEADHAKVADRLAQSLGWSVSRRRLTTGIAGLMLAGSTVGYYATRPAAIAPHTPGPVRSLAVLPFENVSGDAEWQYLADGLTESMINRLARIRDLMVMSRSAVFRIQKTETDAIEQGRRLQVDAILTGSVRHFSDHLEASFELVDCTTGRHLWGQQYRQMFVDPLTFEKSAVEDTATQLRVQLSLAEKQTVLRDYTENTNAYRLYLKGRYEWNKRTQKGYEEAIQYFRRALDEYPSYALAYSGIADAYSMELSTPADIFPKARAAAEMALKIDTEIPEAHASLGFIHLQYDWEWAHAETEFQRAIQLNPNYPSAHSMYARLLCVLGRFPEAEAEAAKAQKLDPLSMGIANGVGLTYYFARDFDSAEKQFKASLALVPSPLTLSVLALTHAANGRATEAVSEYEGLLAADPSDFDTMADLTRAYVLAGRTKDAVNLYERLRNSPGPQSPLPTSLAGASGALNRLDEAFAQLDRAYLEKCWYLMFLKVEPIFDPLRQDRRYHSLLRKMNLAD